jgi:hypothetical protein
MCREVVREPAALLRSMSCAPKSSVTLPVDARSYPAARRLAQTSDNAWRRRDATGFRSRAWRCARLGRARFRSAAEGLRRTAPRRGGLRGRSRGLQRRSELDVDHASPVRRGAGRDHRIRRHQSRLHAALRPVRTDLGPRPHRRALARLSEAPESVSVRPNQ